MVEDRLSLSLSVRMKNIGSLPHLHSLSLCRHLGFYGEGRGVESLKEYSSRDIEEKTGMKDESENGSRGFLYAL